MCAVTALARQEEDTSKAAVPSGRDPRAQLRSAVESRLGFDPNTVRIAVVIPTYKAADTIRAVVEGVPGFVSRIYVIDDACPNKSHEALRDHPDNRLTVIVRSQNGGVGAATMTGFDAAAAAGAQVLVKMDADGQMDPLRLPSLLAPILAGSCAQSKGTRFWHLDDLGAMPLTRRLGNVGLSFLVKVASGQWSVSDPTNGYLAVRVDVWNSLSSAAIAHRFFFESSLLIEMGARGFRVVDVAMPARYADETSTLSVSSALVRFPLRLLVGGTRRFIMRHVWFDFTPTAATFVVAAPLLLFSTIFGATEWFRSVASGQVASAGTVMLAALPALSGITLVLNGLSYEVRGLFNARIRPDSSEGPPGA